MYCRMTDEEKEEIIRGVPFAERAEAVHEKHKKLIIGVVLMVLITLGVYILFKGDGNSIFIGDDTTQAVEFNDINLNEEKDGKVIWNLRARHVRMESDRNTVYLTDIEGFLQKMGMNCLLKQRRGS